MTVRKEMDLGLTKNYFQIDDFRNRETQKL